jgi:predicted oxidoreductase
MHRRIKFVGAAGGACLAAVLAAALVTGAQPAAPAAPAAAQPPATPDAIVVGAGISGLSAAWELARSGASVTVVDMASVFGGHAVMATGDLNMTDTPYERANGVKDSIDLAIHDFLTWGQDANPDWVRIYVQASRPQIFDWVSSMGVSFEMLGAPDGNSVPRMHRTKGRGIALVSPIYRQCLLCPNITFAFSTRADRLLVEGGRVTGIAATSLRTGQALELRAPVVVLATGGFQNNLEMVRQFWSKSLPFPPRILLGSGVNSVGSGLKLAQAAGAQLSRLDHQENLVTGLPDPRYPGSGRGLNASNASAIMVNADGVRFMNERSNARYSLPIVLHQKGATYWSIFDEAAKHTFWIAGSDWGDFNEIEKWIFSNPDLVKSAPTLEALAAKVGLPADALTATVAHYNQLVGAGVDRDFGRFGPGKTYQPKQILQPPFYAMQFYPLTRKSMGGVVIDTSCRVLDLDQRVIPGLYAVGELSGLAGINGKEGLEGTFLGPSIVTGRVAGRAAAVELGRTPGDGKIIPVPAFHPAQPDPQASTQLCLTCHNLPTLVTQKRPGYWHFEKVHTAVLANKFDCVQCHAGISATFQPQGHRIDRLAQILVCATCHKGEDR